MKKWYLLSLMALSLVSCQRPWGEYEIEVPVSIASESEIADIENTLSEIQALAVKVNLPQDFRSFPVVVVDRYPGPTSELVDPAAFCQQDKEGNGVYVGILKSTMENYQKFDKPRAGNAPLFAILVHEFGHCLFHRDHDEAVISIPGLNFYFQSEEGSSDYGNVGAELPVSAMTSSTFKYAFQHYLPKGVKTYYLAEVSGLKRWKTLEDLQETEGIKLLPP